MGMCRSRLTHVTDVEPPTIPPGILASMYQQRLLQLARAVAESPPPEPLEATLRTCIAFCYGVTEEWAPHVRTTVFADNPTEHQSNVLVYGALLCAWGEPSFRSLRVECRPIPATDVRHGVVTESPFWVRSVTVPGKCQVSYRALMHQLLFWFARLSDKDPRKQLLVNILLQLHEACFNCIGRHKEVFEYCVYDLMDAEAQAVVADASDEQASPSSGLSLGTEGARQVVRRMAARFLDRHKYIALHAAILEPLKFVVQQQYSIFENIDSHGASFWVAALTVFFPGLQMPFESIVGLDTGWRWAAVDFLRMMCEGDAQVALERCSAEENLGRDWRSLTRGLSPPRVRLLELPLPYGGPDGFPTALAEMRKPSSQLRKAMLPYAARFSTLLEQPLLLRRCALAAVGSAAWDVAEGPALAALSMEALGESLDPAALRVRLFAGGHCEDASAIVVDESVMAALLQAAGVPWAGGHCEDASAIVVDESVMAALLQAAGVPWADEPRE
eukprot:gnl/TRDRNA2_/TRDRNA2_28140_c0_seq1.p1 gnl/TRDRNA2_/TRDRNA2_28140_c0~~gnl/TRDRNA2_/TRDRNA2_28140_c0_seq1.p1  ORF type:complete len:502 (-),score=82.36 gnl/TRDRNA2_/TRDRNA2_28140_c0_seq1:69-1574(-)